LDKIIKHKNIINIIRAQRLGWLGHIERMQGRRMVKAIYCLVTLTGCKEEEWSRQYTAGNPFQEGQQEDQRHAGRMMKAKILH